MRPHDIALTAHPPGTPSLTAVLRYIAAAGPQARLTVEHVGSRAPIDVEMSRSELESLRLKVGDLASLRLRPGRSFADDYAI